MTQCEVGEAILNSPFDEPKEYWYLSGRQLHIVAVER